jgi:hypothetical protein
MIMRNFSSLNEKTMKKNLTRTLLLVFTCALCVVATLPVQDGYAEGGTKKGVKEGVGGTKKGIKETKKFIKKVF